MLPQIPYALTESTHAIGMQSRRPRLPGSLSTLEDESNVPGILLSEARQAWAVKFRGEGKASAEDFAILRALYGRRPAPGF